MLDGVYRKNDHNGSSHSLVNLHYLVCGAVLRVLFTNKLFFTLQKNSRITQSCSASSKKLLCLCVWGIFWPAVWISIVKECHLIKELKGLFYGKICSSLFEDKRIHTYFSSPSYISDNCIICIFTSRYFSFKDFFLFSLFQNGHLQLRILAQRMSKNKIELVIKRSF